MMMGGGLVQEVGSGGSWVLFPFHSTSRAQSWYTLIAKRARAGNIAGRQEGSWRFCFGLHSLFGVGGLSYAIRSRDRDVRSFKRQKNVNFFDHAHLVLVWSREFIFDDLLDNYSLLHNCVGNHPRFPQPPSPPPLPRFTSATANIHLHLPTSQPTPHSPPHKSLLALARRMPRRPCPQPNPRGTAKLLSHLPTSHHLSLPSKLQVPTLPTWGMQITPTLRIYSQTLFLPQAPAHPSWTRARRTCLASLPRIQVRPPAPEQSNSAEIMKPSLRRFWRRKSTKRTRRMSCSKGSKLTWNRLQQSYRRSWGPRSKTAHWPKSIWQIYVTTCFSTNDTVSIA